MSVNSKLNYLLTNFDFAHTAAPSYLNNIAARQTPLREADYPRSELAPMTLEQYVTSLELAKELKNRDVPQDTEFCWIKGPYGLDQVVERTHSRIEYIAAYTDEELFDLLPTYYDIGGVDYYFETEE